jgi:hypothetical protein
VLNTEPYYEMPITSYNYFCNSTDYNVINRYLEYKQQTRYTVQISETELENLQKFEDQVFNNMEISGHFNLFLTLMEQKEMEHKLREKFPALQKAYENYSLMLNLCTKGEI